MSQRAVMHSHVTMDSQITHNSMCVSSIRLQCNLHRHCSHSSYHASWTSILREGWGHYTFFCMLSNGACAVLKAKIQYSPTIKNLFTNSQAVKQWSFWLRLWCSFLSQRSFILFSSNQGFTLRLSDSTSGFRQSITLSPHVCFTLSFYSLLRFIASFLLRLATTDLRLLNT